MVATEVKSTIHEMIDRIEDSEYLNEMYDSLLLFLNEKSDILHDLIVTKNDKI